MEEIEAVARQFVRLAGTAGPVLSLACLTLFYFVGSFYSSVRVFVSFFWRKCGKGILPKPDWKGKREKAEDERVRKQWAVNFREVATVMNVRRTLGIISTGVGSKVHSATGVYSLYQGAGKKAPAKLPDLRFRRSDVNSVLEDQMFTPTRIPEGSWESTHPVYMCFVLWTFHQRYF